LKPIPRCINLIRESKNLGAILVAFTNCPQEEILALIKRFDFLSDFDLILNSGNLGYRKPHK
jgi:FMN phosphatase YigB (HAD superfamily)